MKKQRTPIEIPMMSFGDVLADLAKEAQKGPRPMKFKKGDIVLNQRIFLRNGFLKRKNLKPEQVRYEIAEVDVENRIYMVRPLFLKTRTQREELADIFDDTHYREGTVDESIKFMDEKGIDPETMK